MKQSRSIQSKQPATFQDTRTPRTIFMNHEGIDQNDLVECWLCHTTRPMKDMTVHHMLEQRLCKKFPWHEGKLKDPAWLVALCGGDLGCHEIHFNLYFHQAVQASLEILDLKQRHTVQRASLLTEIKSLKRIIGGKETRNVNAKITNVQTALEDMQENIGLLNLALEQVKD